MRQSPDRRRGGELRSHGAGGGCWTTWRNTVTGRLSTCREPSCDAEEILPHSSVLHLPREVRPAVLAALSQVSQPETRARPWCITPWSVGGGRLAPVSSWKGGQCLHLGQLTERDSSSHQYCTAGEGRLRTHHSPGRSGTRRRCSTAHTLGGLCSCETAALEF